ncbi:MAG: hypothetical protein ACFFEV_00630 [Candidatus Thorarchaeota archaeon]
MQSQPFKSSLSINSLSIALVISIVWLVGITPILCTAPSNIVPMESSILSGTPDIHSPRMSMGLIRDSELLMRGINMAGYTSTQTAQFTLDDDSVVEEDITPYWFSIGFDLDILRADLDTLQKMGVRHLRITALIFQFLVWDDEFGSFGLNGTIMTKFDLFLQEILNRGMILTVSFLGPYWTYTEHPSLMRYFRIFDETTGMDQWALHNLHLSLVEFTQYYGTRSEIRTWELVSSFSGFIECLTDTQTGFGLTINATSIFDFVESVADDIKAANNLHFVTVSDGWPPDFDENWWTTGLVPVEYEGRLRNLTDIISLIYHSDESIPNPEGAAMKYGAIVEIASTQPENHSREINSEILLNAFAEAIGKRYSAFCPWEFSQNIVVHEEGSTMLNHNRHDWNWDALLLFSLYRNDTVKFVNTTNWYVLSSEPQFDQFGRVGFTLFHRPEGMYPAPYGFEDGRVYDPAEGGTEVTVLSPNLLIGDALITNRKADSTQPLYNQDELGTYEYATTIATIHDVGLVTETGIQVESNQSWETVVDRYDNLQIAMKMNATGPFNIEVKDGNFTIIAGYDYSVSYTDRLSGATWEEIAKADANKTIKLSIDAGSLTIRIALSQDVLGPISVGVSISVIVISVVMYYTIERKNPKEKNPSKKYT